MMETPTSNIQHPEKLQVASTRTRERIGANPFTQKPGFQTYYTLGVAYSKALPGFCSYADVARYLGVTKQNAYTECVIALGKLVYWLGHLVGSEASVPAFPGRLNLATIEKLRLWGRERWRDSGQMRWREYCEYKKRRADRGESPVSFSQFLKGGAA